MFPFVQGSRGYSGEKVSMFSEENSSLLGSTVSKECWTDNLTTVNVFRVNLEKSGLMASMEKG